MAEYNIEKKAPDLKDALDYLVHNRLTEELYDNEESIKDFSYRIRSMFNQMCKNNDGSINRDNEDAIRNLMTQAAQLNEMHDKKYREELENVENNYVNSSESKDY